MKSAITIMLMACFVVLSLSVTDNSWAQEKRIKVPLTEEQMKPYDKISFSLENFEKIKRGMTQLEVLELLGKPLKVKKEHRRHNRWTVHYFYQDGYVVNFKDGLVVGKEASKE